MGLHLASAPALGGPPVSLAHPRAPGLPGSPQVSPGLPVIGAVALKRPAAASSSLDPLPPWVEALVAAAPKPATPEQIMALAVAIAQANAENGHGPFGAVVADAEGDVVEVGWNAVVTAKDSTAHAEIVALRRAQQRLGTHDLSAPGGLAMYASCAPCIQCFGALYWSGLKVVHAAARRDDAEALGFKEGPVSPELWKRAFEERGIQYRAAFGRSAAALRPFATYRAQGGPLY